MPARTFANCCLRPTRKRTFTGCAEHALYKMKGEMGVDDKDNRSDDRQAVEHSRRDFLKGTAVAAGAGLAAAAAVPGVASAAEADARPQNPYGSRSR